MPRRVGAGGTALLTLLAARCGELVQVPPEPTAGFFFQAEDGIRDCKVTGVQTCALPISEHWDRHKRTTRPVACTTGTPISVAVTPSWHGSCYPTIRPKPPNTCKTPAPSPIAPVTSNSNSAASTRPANSSGTSAITLSPSRKAKPASSWRTLAASQSIAEGEAGILLADTCGFGKYS